MPLRFPNSDARLRYKDVSALEETITYLSARLAEEKHMNEDHVRNDRSRMRDLAVLRDNRFSFAFQNDAVTNACDSGKFFLPDVEKLVFVEPCDFPGKPRLDGRSTVRDVHAVFGLWADPSLSFVDGPVPADDKDAGVKRVVLSNDEFEFVVTLEIHSKRGVADNDFDVVSHESSSSVGTAVNTSNPTEGEARKGRPADSGCADGEGASCQ